MNNIIKSHFENARESLRTHRFRTFLALVGVMIGVAGVTLSLSLATSATKTSDRSAVHLPPTIALLRSGLAVPATPLSFYSQSATATTLRPDDATMIAKQHHITAAPMAFAQAKLVTSARTLDIGHATIIGTTGSLKDIADITMLEGQFIDEANGAVISPQLSIDLFGTERSLGSVITIQGEPITVVGIANPVAEGFRHLGITPQATLFLPLDRHRKLTQHTAQIQHIAIKATDATTLRQRLPAITADLTKRHHDTADFHLITSDDLASQRAQTINTISLVAAVIAGISLLIGGVGVMNGMLVAVAERQREIGIRKAVGATNGHIISQFLVEAIIVSLLGGVAGYGLGVGAAYMLSFYLPFHITLQWQIALAALIVALMTGLIFGLYPATRAAVKDPIEALRY